MFRERRGWGIVLSTILLIAGLMYINGMIYKIKRVEYEVQNLDEFILKYSLSIYVVNKFINSDRLVIFYPDSIDIINIYFNGTHYRILVRALDESLNLNIYYKIIVKKICN